MEDYSKHLSVFSDTHTHTDRQTDRYTLTQTNRQIHKHSHKETDRNTLMQTNDKYIVLS